MNEPRCLLPADTPVLGVIPAAGTFQDKAGTPGQGLQSGEWKQPYELG